LNHKLFLVILLSFIAFVSKSQTTHFVFIQTDDNQLFYVKANNQIFSSTSLGSVIVPNLEEGDLIINIGFPQNKWNPLKYKLSLKNKDLAYVLKKSKSNSWELYDYYSMNLIESVDTSRVFNNAINPVNDFAKLLSQVSGVYLESNFSAELISENVIKDIIVSKPVQVSMPKKETEISSDKQPESKVDTMLVMLSDSKKEDTSHPIVNSFEKDSIIQSSKKKENFLIVDTSITTIDSSSLTKNKSDTLFHESRSLNVKVDMSEIKINLQIDTLAKEVNKGNQVDTLANTFINGKRTDTIVSSDTSNLMSTIIISSRSDSSLQKSTSAQKDLIFIENVAIQQLGLAPDSIAVMKEFKIQDSLSKAEKKQLTEDKLSKHKESVTTKDSFDFKSGSIEIDSTSDTTKTNLNLDTSISQSNIVKKAELSLAKDSVIIKEVNLAEDTTKAKSNCKAIASDNDFIQLRRSMTKEDEESKMISTALVIFKEKCFSTSQIKNLAVLFLRDDAKYLFLESAFLYTSDLEHFESLQSLLSEEKNINSFKKIINQTKAKE
jgi:hypothetical protein